MSKRQPELLWQDKVILVSIPIVVFTIFILANYFSQDLTVADAFKQQLADSEIRDIGHIIQVYPAIATSTISCRVKSADSLNEYDFHYNVTGTESIRFDVGRQIQFYGKYKYDAKGGEVTAPYKGKSGRMTGWVIYENYRYVAKGEEEKNAL